MKNESKIDSKSAHSGTKVKKKRRPTSCDDPEWKIAARNRSAELEIMKRTTFPDKLSLEPVNGQKVIGFVLIVGILTVVCYAAILLPYNQFMQNSISRRASYMLVYKVIDHVTAENHAKTQALHTSKMTEFDQKIYEKIWTPNCSAMYVSDKGKWTPWRYGLRPMPDTCPQCHKVIKIRTRVLIVREPPFKGQFCPATVQWEELADPLMRDLIFNGTDIVERQQ